MPQRRYVLTQQYPADRCPTQPEGDTDFCTYKAEQMGLSGTDFAIEKLELKATLRVVVNDRLHDVWWVFYIVCLSVLSNICSH